MLQGHRCKFKIDKTTYSNRNLEQRMTLAKIILHCIIKNQLIRVLILRHNNYHNEASKNQFTSFLASLQLMNREQNLVHENESVNSILVSKIFLQLYPLIQTSIMWGKISQYFQVTGLAEMNL